MQFDYAGNDEFVKQIIKQIPSDLKDLQIIRNLNQHYNDLFEYIDNNTKRANDKEEDYQR